MNPAAPAPIAASTVCWSVAAESTTTGNPGYRVRQIFKAGIPDSPGRFRSSRTRSGSVPCPARVKAALAVSRGVDGHLWLQSTQNVAHRLLNQRMVIDDKRSHVAVLSG